MAILTIISIVISAIGVWQRCARPEAVLRRLKKGIGFGVLEGIVEDSLEVESAGSYGYMVDAVAARPDSEIYKFAMEIKALVVGRNALNDLSSVGAKKTAIFEATKEHCQTLTIERVKAMMAEAEGLGMKP